MRDAGLPAAPPPPVAPARAPARGLRAHLLRLLLATIAPLVALAIALTIALIGNERDTARRALTDIAHTLSAAVDAEVGRTLVALQLLASDDAFDRADFATMRERAETARRLHGRWSNVVVARADGTRVLNLRVPSGQTIPGPTEGEPELAAARRGESYISGVSTSPTSGKVNVYVSVPVLRAGEARFVVTATVEYDVWTDWLRAQVPANAWAAIDDRDGVIFARSDTPERFVGRPAVDELRKAYRAQQQGLVQLTNREGARLYAGFATSALTGWHTLVLMSAQEIDRGMRQALAAAGSAALLLLAVAVWGAELAARPLRRGLAQLRDGIGELGHGRTPAVPPLPVGEMEEASRAARDAAALLQQSRSAVDERTEALERRQDELRRAQAELQAADRQKNEFLVTLAHELRNPMAPIRYAAALIRPDATPAMLEQARQTIERQSGHIARLLDDLLDLSRISRNVIELKRETLDLRSVVQAAVDNVAPTLARHGHALAVDLGTVPLPVHGDRTRLLQVLDNLLSNACKYTPDGGHIKVQADGHGERCRVSVRDDGIGIAPELLPNVFALFGQAHPELPSAQGGLGIGLAVVKRLVELHGGTIEVASDGPGRGATFTITLPFAPAGAPAASEAPAAGTAAPLPALKVLVVDDNVDAAETLAALLQLDGCEVAVAHTAATAEARAAQWHPDVAVLDLGLPDRSGLELGRALRAQPWAQGLVIAAATGWGQSADRAETAAAGFDAHLVKPVDPAELAALLRRVPRRAP